VSQIATFGTMSSKAVIRDVGRVFGLPYSMCDRISKLIPIVQNKPVSLAEALEQEPQLKEMMEGERRRNDPRAVRPGRPPRGPDPQRRHARRRRADRAGQDHRFLPDLQADRRDASPVSQFDKDDVEKAAWSSSTSWACAT
jgi:DNA polymerase-3 subunit alpha